jgi:hypothetical protein
MRQLVGSRMKTALSTPAASRTRRSPRAKRTLTRFHPVDYDRGRGIDVQRLLAVIGVRVHQRTHNRRGFAPGFLRDDPVGALVPAKPLAVAEDCVAPRPLARATGFSM